MPRLSRFRFLRPALIMFQSLLAPLVSTLNVSVEAAVVVMDITVLRAVAVAAVLGGR